MKVQAYRDCIQLMFRTINDWHACIDKAERDAWRIRASRIYEEFCAATCSRASGRDKEFYALAKQSYSQILSSFTQPVPLQAAPAKTSMSRAAKYNGSASRSVRLSRAARSAMRRGYF